MKKRIVVLSLLSSCCVYAMDILKEDLTEGMGAHTVGLIGDNEEILRSAGVSVASAQEIITENLQKREKKLQEQEYLEDKFLLTQKLESQILQSLTALESELAKTELNVQAIEKEVAKLNLLSQELQAAPSDTFLTRPIEETAADKKDEQVRQLAYRTDLQERIKGIKEGMVRQQEQSVDVQRKLNSVRTVVIKLEDYTLEIAEAYEGAAGSATVDILREAAEERKQDVGKQEELSDEQPKSSGFWNRCTVS